MLVLNHPNFSTFSAGYPGCYSVKLGWGSMWIKVTFSESTGSTEYRYVFSFLRPCRSLPYIWLRTAVLALTRGRDRAPWGNCVVKFPLPGVEGWQFISIILQIYTTFAHVHDLCFSFTHMYVVPYFVSKPRHLNQGFKICLQKVLWSSVHPMSTRRWHMMYPQTGLSNLWMYLR